MPDVSVFNTVESQAAADAYIEEVLASPTCSHWLRAALQSGLQRDPVDAANDAEALSLILQVRAAAILNAASRNLK